MKNLFLFFLLAFTCLWAFGQQTLSLFPFKDTYINSTIPDLFQGDFNNLVASFMDLLWELGHRT